MHCAREAKAMRHWLAFVKTEFGIHEMLLAGTEILTVTGEPAPVFTNENVSVVTTASEIVLLSRSL